MRFLLAKFVAKRWTCGSLEDLVRILTGNLFCWARFRLHNKRGSQAKRNTHMGGKPSTLPLDGIHNNNHKPHHLQIHRWMQSQLQAKQWNGYSYLQRSTVTYGLLWLTDEMWGLSCIVQIFQFIRSIDRASAGLVCWKWNSALWCTFAELKLYKYAHCMWVLNTVSTNPVADMVTKWVIL